MSAKVSECERPGRKSIGMICIPAEAAAVHAALALQSAGAVPNLVRGKLASQNLLWLLPSPRHKPFRESTIRFVNGENSFPIYIGQTAAESKENLLRWFDGFVESIVSHPTQPAQKSRARVCFRADGATKDPGWWEGMSPREQGLVLGRLNWGPYLDWGTECKANGLFVGKLKVAYVDPPSPVFTEVPAGPFLSCSADCFLGCSAD